MIPEDPFQVRQLMTLRDRRLAITFRQALSRLAAHARRLAEIV